MTDLYLDKHPELVEEFKKEAGYSARLSDQSENWAQEAVSELLKQYPFFSDYEVNPVLDRAEPQRGYGFGYVDVTNRTERPEQEHLASGIPHIRVPIIVQERQLRPFNVFLDGEAVKPLNEDRIRETLFNPQTFDLSVSQPSDPNMTDSFMPPTRSGVGGGEIKTASAASVVAEEAAAMGKRVMRRATRTAEGGVVAYAGARAANKKSKEKEKQAFAHITQEQWKALYKNPKIQQLVQKKGKYDDPEVDNAVFEVAAKRYGYHPKTASAIPLLQAIAPTVNEKDAEEFLNKLASDPTLQVGLRSIRHLVVETFENVKRASAEDRFEALAENIHPTVVTYQRLPGGQFLVKSASAKAFKPGKKAQGEVKPEQEVAEDIGPDLAGQMKPGQTATAVADPVPGNGNPQAGFEGQPITEFGEYTVQDTMGNTLMGWVIPELLSWDGNFSPQPIALFTNGSAYAMQDSIAGKLVGKGVGLPVDEPRGDGVFYSVSNQGVVATVPLTVTSAMAGPDGNPVYQGTDPFGNPVVVRTVAGMLNPERISNNEYAFPEGWQFMRLNNQTQLAGAGGEVSKTAAALATQNSVTLFYNGAWQLEGECGLDKLASEYRHDLDSVSAEFMLGLLGVEGSVAKQKVAEARKNGSVKLAGLKTITLFEERQQEAVKEASVFLTHFPNLRRDLIKEAAAIGDEGTVDKVLALNFINPENVSTFVEYLPQIEETGEQLSEMLLNSYLGMNELPEGALERAMRGMEEVASGLKALQQSSQGS